MPRVERLNFGIRNVALVGFRARRDEVRVVLALDREQRWLVRAEIFLEGGTEGYVAAVVEDQIKLDFLGSWAWEVETDVSLHGASPWHPTLAGLGK